MLLEKREPAATAAGSLSGNLQRLGTRRIGRLVVEETGKLGVIDDYRRIALDGVEVFFLERIAGFRGNKHFSRQRYRAAGVLRGDGLFGGQSFVDAHHEFRDVMQPGKLRVVDHQTEELAGVDVSVLALVIPSFHVEKCLVDLEKS